MARGGRPGTDSFHRLRLLASVIASNVWGKRAASAVIIRAPRVAVCQGERRGEKDGASGPRERYRCCELAPCAQPVRHTRVFDESCATD